MTTTIADLATLEDAVVRAAVRFIGCAGEFEGNLEYCGEWLDALETAVVRLEKGREAMTGSTEFDCLDCGHRIVSYASAVSIDRCASCRWIRANVPPEDQPAARERLGVPLTAP